MDSVPGTSARVTRFNVSKKIAQLNRVVQIFLGERADREYRVEYLRSQYAVRFTTEFQAYTEAITVLQNELNRLVDSAHRENESLFRAKYETLVKDHCEREETIRTEVSTFTDKASRTLDELETTLAQISNPAECDAALNVQIDNFKSKLRESLQTLKQTHKQELDTLRTESEKALTDLINSTDEKLANIAREHETRLRAVENEFSSSNAMSFIHDTNTQMKSRASIIKSDSVTAKSSGESMMANFANTIARFRKRNREIESQYQADSKAFSEAIELAKSKNEQVSNALKREAMEASNRKLQEKARLEQELERLRAETAEEIAKLQQEFSAKKDEYQKAINSSSGDISDIKTKHKQEKIKVLDEMERQKNEINSRIEGISKNVSAALEKCALEEKAQRENAKTASEKRNSEIAELTNELTLVRDQLQTQLNEERHALRRKMEDSQEHRSQTHRQHSGHLLDMQEKKNGLIQAHKTACSQLETEASLECDNLRVTLQSELDEASRSDAEKIALVEAECLTRKSQKIAEHERLKQERIKEMNAIYEREMKRIETEFHNDPTVSRLAEQLVKEFDSESKKLNKIPPPKDDNGKFAQMTAEMDGLVIQRSEAKIRFGADRKTMTARFEENVNIENERHKAAIAPQKSGRANLSLKQNLIQKVTDAKQATEDARKEMERELHKVQQQHETNLEKLQIELRDAQSTEPVDSLRDQLQAMAHSSELEIGAAQRAADTETKSVALSNEEKESEYKRRISELNSQFAFLESGNEEIRKLQKEYDMNYHDHECQWQLQTDRQFSIVSNSRNKFNDTCIQMKQQISETELAITAAARDRQDSLVQCDEENARRLRAVEDDLAAMLDRHRADARAVEDFMNEKIDILEKRRDEAKTKYEQRPPRDCEREQITALEIRADTLMIMLKNAVKDMSQYRRLLVLREQEYNHYFGKDPNVGTLVYRRQ